MDKKILIIIVLAVLLGGLLVFTITRREGIPEEDFDKVRAERDQFERTVIELKDDLKESVSRVGELEVLVDGFNEEIESNLDELAEGHQRTDGYLREYGDINSDLRDFLCQNGKEE